VRWEPPAVPILSPENRVGECHARDAQSGRVRAVFIPAGRPCPAVSVVV
jgi:hypothetical protein